VPILKPSFHNSITSGLLSRQLGSVFARVEAMWNERDGVATLWWNHSQ